MGKQNIQAAFFDVDNTLYNHHDQCVPDLHVEALKQLKKQGIKICLSTGRSLPLIKDLGVLDLIEWDGIVAGNGSFIYDKDQTILFENTMSTWAVHTISHHCQMLDIPLLASGNTVIVDRLNDQSQKILTDFHIHDFELRDPKDSDRFSVITLCLKDPKMPLDPFEKISEIKILRHPAFVDLMKDGLSKFQGISVLMKHFGLDPHSYIAFGDSMNDLEMLENAAIGVFMEDGDPNLGRRIAHHCPSNRQAGIYTFLKQEGLL